MKSFSFFPLWLIWGLKIVLTSICSLILIPVPSVEQLFRKYFLVLTKGKCYSQLLLVHRSYTFSKIVLYSLKWFLLQQPMTTFRFSTAFSSIQNQIYTFFLEASISNYLLYLLQISDNVSLLLMALFLILKQIYYFY